MFRRKGAFWISYSDSQGRRHQRKLKGVISLTKAKELRAAQLAQVEEARLKGYEEPTKDRFATIAPRYLNHQQARLTPRAYKRSADILDQHLMPIFGTMEIAAIRRRDVQRYLTGRLRDVSRESARKEFFVLRHMLQFAVEEQLIPVNHANGVELPKAPPGRLRYLQPTELHAVLEACPEWLRPIAGLLAFTGMRRGEVLGLRWMDIDRKGRKIILPQTKNGDGRVVSLNKLAMDVIDSLTAGSPTSHVFTGMTPENVSLAFLRTCRKVGIADFRLHDLRHTAASWLRMTGADLQDVARVLGHKDLRMTMRYAHLSEAHDAAVAAKLDKVFQPLALAASTDGN